MSASPLLPFIKFAFDFSNSSSDIGGLVYALSLTADDRHSVSPYPLFEYFFAILLLIFRLTVSSIVPAFFAAALSRFN